MASRKKATEVVDDEQFQFDGEVGQEEEVFQEPEQSQDGEPSPSVFDQLMRAAKETDEEFEEQGENEGTQEFLMRLVSVIDGADDSVFDTLTNDAMDWYNDSAKSVNNELELTEPEGYTEPETPPTSGGSAKIAERVRVKNKKEKKVNQTATDTTTVPRRSRQAAPAPAPAPLPSVARLHRLPAPAPAPKRGKAAATTRFPLPLPSVARRQPTDAKAHSRQWHRESRGRRFALD